MTKFLVISIALFAVSAQAKTYKFSMPTSAVQIQKMQSLNLGANLNSQSENESSFTQLSFQGFETSKTVGAPELPVKTFLIQGKPSDISVRIQASRIHTLKDIRPMPVQPQACRCDDQIKTQFAFDASAYKAPTPQVQKNYLGAFRGQHITQVVVSLASFDAETNQVRLFSEGAIDIGQPEFPSEPTPEDPGQPADPVVEYKDYLIIGSEALLSGAQEFIDHKKALGFNVLTETLNSTNTTLAAITAMVAKHYAESGTDFVIILGDELQVPMFKLVTSGSSRTPSDLKHFTMDGPEDYVPDMFYSRLPAANADEVKAILSKSIQFETKSALNPSGWKRFIGIASNEGSKPSDNEYVLKIDESFKAAYADMQSVHLYQNDSVNSNPKVLNATFNEGAFWLTYLGHGSGTAWPSMNRTYSTSDIKAIANADAVKPIIIDVACMNGQVTPNFFGSTFMRTKSATSALGAAAYYGGTVNISWHPPAVMAQGIAFKHIEKKFKHLGQALLAGQLYLAEKWANKTEVIDNFEWYHLQGDPGMAIEFQ